MPKDAKKKVNDKKEKKDKKHFFKDVKAELKKVIWPTPKQLFNNTLAVIVIVIIVGVIVFALDVCFEKLNSLGVEQLKTIVQKQDSEEIIEEESPVTDEDEDNADTDTSIEIENSEQIETEDAE